LLVEGIARGLGIEDILNRIPNSDGVGSQELRRGLTDLLKEVQGNLIKEQV
jgi:hypothetical protein